MLPILLASMLSVADCVRFESSILIAAGDALREAEGRHEGQWSHTTKASPGTPLVVGGAARSRPPKSDVIDVTSVADLKAKLRSGTSVSFHIAPGKYILHDPIVFPLGNFELVGLAGGVHFICGVRSKQEASDVSSSTRRRRTFQAFPAFQMTLRPGRVDVSIANMNVSNCSFGFEFKKGGHEDTEGYEDTDGGTFQFKHVNIENMSSGGIHLNLYSIMGSRVDIDDVNISGPLLMDDCERKNKNKGKEAIYVSHSDCRIRNVVIRDMHTHCWGGDVWGPYIGLYAYEFYDLEIDNVVVGPMRCGPGNHEVPWAQSTFTTQCKGTGIKLLQRWKPSPDYSHSHAKRQSINASRVVLEQPVRAVGATSSSLRFTPLDLSVWNSDVYLDDFKIAMPVGATSKITKDEYAKCVKMDLDRVSIELTDFNVTSCQSGLHIRGANSQVLVQSSRLSNVVGIDNHALDSTLTIKETRLEGLPRLDGLDNREFNDGTGVLMKSGNVSVHNVELLNLGDGLVALSSSELSINIVALRCKNLERCIMASAFGLQFDVDNLSVEDVGSAIRLRDTNPQSPSMTLRNTVLNSTRKAIMLGGSAQLNTSNVTLNSNAVALELRDTSSAFVRSTKVIGNEEHLLLHDASTCTVDHTSIVFLNTASGLYSHKNITHEDSPLYHFSGSFWYVIVTIGYTSSIVFFIMAFMLQPKPPRTCSRVRISSITSVICSLILFTISTAVIVVFCIALAGLEFHETENFLAILCKIGLSMTVIGLASAIGLHSLRQRIELFKDAWIRDSVTEIVEQMVQKATDHELIQELHVMHVRVTKLWEAGEAEKVEILFGQMKDLCIEAGKKLTFSLSSARKELFKSHTSSKIMAIPSKKGTPLFKLPQAIADNSAGADFAHRHAHWILPKFKDLLKEGMRRLSLCATTAEAYQLGFITEEHAKMLGQADLHPEKYPLRRMDHFSHALPEDENEYGGLLLGSIKDKARALAKALEYEEEGCVGRLGIEHVSDWARATFYSNNGIAMCLMFYVLENLFGSYLKVKSKLGDESLEEQERISILCIVEITDEDMNIKMPCEIQFIPQDLLILKELQHLFYDVARAQSADAIVGKPIFRGR